ncbi:hypothetical protein HDU85_004982 [Gaertneriomyces sp. JEL0708]|nr:hypothetical protein HDU85_004982 [Gaertneriomyces sp. JEL0708]
MSDRAFANLHSMRDNYATYGVENYYTNVAATYRNPHWEGIRTVLSNWMDVWWDKEGRQACREPEHSGFTILDMAAGSGEVTETLLWWADRMRRGVGAGRPRGLLAKPLPAAVDGAAQPPQSVHTTQDPRLHISATDPFTEKAYTSRTNLPCHSLSFRDIADGQLPCDFYDMIVCSFALHLVTDNSELFSLLWELSSKARWLVIIAPGKRPEIKDGWGWRLWDCKSWNGEKTSGNAEFTSGKSRARIFRSSNF